MTASTVNLLADIQRSLLGNDKDIAPILTKVRFLAGRLHGDVLEQWVQNEIEGYPAGVEVPHYRLVTPNLEGHFSGPYGRILRNAPIPSLVVDKILGFECPKYQIRNGMAEIDHLVAATNKSDTDTMLLPGYNDLIPALQGEFYPGMVCNQVVGRISTTIFIEIQSVVRNRLLSLSLKLEQKTEAANVQVVPSGDSSPRNQGWIVNNITKQVIHGDSNSTNITASGDSTVAINVQAKDKKSLSDALVAARFEPKDVTKLVELIAEDTVTPDTPLGVKVRDWIKKNIPGIGSAVVANVLSQLALQFHGLV